MQQTSFFYRTGPQSLNLISRESETSSKYFAFWWKAQNISSNKHEMSNTLVFVTCIPAPQSSTGEYTPKLLGDIILLVYV